MAKIRTSESGHYLVHECPGCKQFHLIPIKDEAVKWTFNGNFDKPTLTPSVKHTWGAGRVCHYFISDGRIEYCGDCSHRLSGQAVDLTEVTGDW